MNYSSQHEQYLRLKTTTLTVCYLPPPASFELQNWRIFENFFRPLCSTTGFKQNSDDIMKHNIAVAIFFFPLPVLKLKYSQGFFTHIFKDFDNRFRVYEAIISTRKGRKCLMLIYKSNKTQHNNQHLKVFSLLSKWSNYKTGLDNFCHSNKNMQHATMNCWVLHLLVHVDYPYGLVVAEVWTHGNHLCEEVVVMWG